MSKAIERGAASIIIELSGGNITITHGTDEVELAKITQAADGTWDALWDFLSKQSGFERSR